MEDTDMKQTMKKVKKKKAMKKTEQHNHTLVLFFALTFINIIKYSNSGSVPRFLSCGQSCVPTQLCDLHLPQWAPQGSGHLQMHCQYLLPCFLSVNLLKNKQNPQHQKQTSPPPPT